MSDPPVDRLGDGDDFGSERPDPLPPDWRARVLAGLDAAEISVGAALSGAVVVLAAVLVSAVVVAPRLAGQPPVEEVLPFTRAPVSTTTTSAPAPEQLAVHVAGAVVVPGVYLLPSGARVVDALDAAGGPRATADLSRLNLAAPLSDGEQVYVVVFGEDPPPAVSIGAAGDEGPTGSEQLIDVNRADAAALEELPGIGPTLAAAIVQHREDHGPFDSIDALLDVPGIGDAKLGALRDLVTV